MKKAALSSILVAVMLLLLGIAEAQQPKKVPRIGYLARPIQLLSPPVPRQFAWLCASLVT